MRHIRPLLGLLLLLMAGCAYAEPSPVGTNCVHTRARSMPVCE
jgi:hypothetical protein